MSICWRLYSITQFCTSLNLSLLSVPLFVLVFCYCYVMVVSKGRPEYHIQHIERPPPVHRMPPVAGGGRTGD